MRRATLFPLTLLLLVLAAAALPATAASEIPESELVACAPATANHW